MPDWILMLDEDLHTRLTIAHVFAQRGFIILEAAKVSDVLDCAKRLDLACMFLTVDSPESDGITLLRLLRESYPYLPVAVVAHRLTERLAQEARRHGARCCLERPISGAVIEEFATEVCSARPRGGVAESVRGPRQLACA